MEKTIYKKVTCPICIETLKQPIKMLSCGHSFCHRCIERHCKSSRQSRCPSCRKEISTSIDQIPRNFALESLIEDMSNMSISLQTIVLSGDALKQLRDAAAMYMTAKEYHKALPTLQTLIVQEEGADKLLSMAMKARCEIKLGADPTVCCVKMASTLEQIEFRNTSVDVVDRLDNELSLLVESFCVISFETALLLQRCRFDVIKGYCKGERKLKKLNKLGFRMQFIAQEMKKYERGKDFKNQFSFLESVLTTMQRTDIVDLKLKCKLVAAYLKHYGYCCLLISDYQKSADKNLQAICLLETVLAVEADNYIVYGACFHNLGAAYDGLTKFNEARRCFEIALRIYNQVNDWKNANQKNENILLTSKCLQDVKEKLQRFKN